MPTKRALHAWMLTAATALSARGKLLDASRTQRLRKDTDRSSVLGMAASFTLDSARDGRGRRRGRRACANRGAAETARRAVDDDAAARGPTYN